MNKIRYLSLLMLLFSSIALWGNSAPPSSPYMRTQDGETLLTVVTDPPEGGTVSGGGSYVAGTQVNLRATANTNFQFVNWTLNGEEISTERNFTYTKKDADETLIAHFVYNPKDPNEPTEPVKQTRLDVVADPMDGGSVSGGGKFATGAQVSLKASPNTGFVFVNWTRNGEKVSTERNFTYSKEDGDETLIAHFAYLPGNPNEPDEPDIKPVAKKYKLTVVSEEGGTNVSGSGEYVSGTQVTLSVSISTGFSFQGWYNESDSLLSTSTRFGYTTQERDETITARIKYTPNNPSEPEEPNLPSKPKPHKITVLAVPSDGGSVSVGSETVVEGEQTRVRATANTGFVFQGWYVADTLFQTAADFYYTMGNKDISMEARFVYNPSSPGEPEETGKKSYTLYLTSVRGLPGRTVQYPIYLSSQDSLTNIQFNITFPIGLTPDIENIKLSGKAQGYTLSCKEVEVTTDETQSAPRRAADRETAYQFTLTDGKLPACNTRLMVIDVAISENVTDTTQQVKINQVTVTDTEGTNTTASTRNGAVVMTESSGDGTYYYLTLISTGSGQATVNSRTVRNSLHIFDLLEGSSTNVYFTPDNGYHIDKVTLDEVDITDQVLESSRYLFSNVNADATLTVMFAEGSSSAYDLTLKTDGHGKISYNGIDVGSDEKVFSVSHGAHVEMVITPDEGYHIKQVLLNDTVDVTSQVAEGQYVIESMTTANKVFASFEENPTVVTPLIVRNGNKVAISTTTENAVIYYTLDGSEPTNQSTLFTDSITVEHNCIVKAIAYRENYYPSQVATFEVDWFKVADVTFAQNGRKVALATATANASIYYKIGEGDLDVLYTDTLTLDGSCTIRATAKRDGYNDADVTSYEFNADSVTVAKPVFARKDSIVTISTETPEAVIHYTLDGTLPTGSSAVYEKPIVVEQNGVIKAIALRDNWFDSAVDSLVVDWFKVADVTFEPNGHQLTLATETENATVHYSLSTGESGTFERTGILTLENDCVVEAYATKDGYLDSEITKFEFHVGVVTVVTPVIVANKPNRIGISTTTELATIYYTMDGSIPDSTSTVYTDSIIVESNCTIKAIAMRENYYPSQVATFEVDWFKVADVTFAQNGRKVALATTTANASVYYKIGEGDLDVLYTDMLTLDGSCTIRATAKRDGYKDADVTSYEFNADSVTVAKPVFARKDSIVTISTETPEAVIHYTLDGTLPTGSSAVYEKPIVIEQNGVIKAIALRDNWFDSEIASLTIDRFKCEKPVIVWNGDELTASTATEDAIIQYALTQSGVETPLDQGSEASPLKITVTQDVTIHLYAVKTGWSNSDTLVVDYPYTAWSELFSAIQECTVVVAQCTGNSKVDQQKVQTLQNLCALANTMYNERVASSNEIVSRSNELNALAAELLQQLNAIDYVYDSVGVLTINGGTSVAEALEAAGGRAEVAKSITAIVWNNTFPLTNSDLQGLDNPNMLIYVAANSLAPDNRDNVVIGDFAKNIVLTDVSEGNGNFYCPRMFTAEMISYTHEYHQATEPGVARGWETIALPFTVQTIMHENGQITPFAADTINKHFWLRQLTQQGLARATVIEANTPYLISMPNNEVYPVGSNLNGRVTFSSQNVEVPQTQINVVETHDVNDNMLSFVPCFQSQSADEQTYALNVGKQYNDYPEGSVFVANYRNIRPFEAFTVHNGKAPAPQYIPIFDMNGTTGIEDVRGLMSDGRGEKWYDLNGRRLQQKPTQKGIYILNGKKIVIK